MPKKRFKTVTISEELYKKLERILVEENYKAGYRRFKSINELLDFIVEEWAKQQ